jgi:tRNA/tmRNA/rRNA uracil-C5-methylase (TrmA/RlmC/RlmD family)
MITEKKTVKKSATKRASKPNKKADAPNLFEDAKPYIAHLYRFIDLFCGIGGFRIAFEKAGEKCVR